MRVRVLVVFRHGVTGKFGPGNQGVINLVKLGRSTFTWTAPGALVLMFSDPQQVERIEEDAKFRFKCRVANFDYQYLNMDDCTVVRE